MEQLKDKRYLLDVWCDRGQYLRGEEVKLLVLLAPHEEAVELTVTVSVLYRELLKISQISSPGEEQAVISLGTFGSTGNQKPGIEQKDELLGFDAAVREEKSGYCLHTAFDVAGRADRLLRYGFLSDFTGMDRGVADLDSLLKYHINTVQFYDWSYRHDELVSPVEEYRDMMGKEISLPTVTEKIQGCHQRGMKTMAYGAVYAACKSYHDGHPEQGFYTATGRPYVFIDTFYLMNVADRGWKEHLIGQYRAAMERVGFDGIHMDTYGFPKTAFSLEKKYIRLEEEFPALIKAVRQALPEGRFIFNNVGGWPVAQTADTPQNAVYIEVWPPNDTYAHIRQIIREAGHLCRQKKTVIISAYLAPFRTEAAGEKAVNAALFLFAVIAAHGATHLLLGEENAVLTQGYYSDYTVLPAEAADRLRRYNDFAVCFAGLLYDPSLQDVTQTHMGWDNTEYRCGVSNWSASPCPGALWLTVREDSRRKLIQLINFTGTESMKWNEGKDRPAVCRDIPFTVQVDFAVSGVFYASPDCHDGAMTSLPFNTAETDRGLGIEFSVPEVVYWGIVYVEMDSERNQFI